MAQRIDPDSFLKRSREGVVVDVRTPKEYVAGHIPGAYNIPLFTDEERAVVGTIYKKNGRDAAVQRGLEFVGPRMAGIAQRARQLSEGRGIFLYCWRGGMRSGSVAWLLETAGMNVILLEGGYKAYRHSFEQLLNNHKWRFVLLFGPTACGKTQLLRHVAECGEQVLDFEGIASHKGSVFGGLGQRPQPTTEHFINLLHKRFRELSPDKPVWCEGESMLVGHVFIPQPLYDMVRTGMVIEIGMKREERLDRLMVEYGGFPQEELAVAFSRIAKRMGREQVANAIGFLVAGDIRSAAAMALDYYDKVYARNLLPGNDLINFEAENGDMAGSAKRLIQLKNKFSGYDN